MMDLPLKRAELRLESDEPVAGEVRRVRGGWAVHDPSGHLLLFDSDLRVQRRFPVPDRFHPRGTYDWDVHPGGRWAVFSDTRHTTCVGPDGDIAWEADHPALVNVDGCPVLVCAKFRPDRDELHVFPGMKDDYSSVEDAGHCSASWVVSLSDMTVTKDGPYDQDRWVIFPDGRHIGSSYFDGHDITGWCGRWDEGENSVGSSRPVDIHPDGTMWLGEAFGYLCMNPLEQPCDTDDSDDDVETDHDRYDEAFFLDRNLVLAATQEPLTHELLAVDTLERIARVTYPFTGEEWYWLAAAGDGTWVTTSRSPGRESARLCLWRLA
ncbi:MULTISPECIES: hypothetical protein [Streptomyces]|uniref:WD40 repeat domain-containing protein n=1 Tax=Streptomyces lonegramiae TaxID=3075524 RepID=A0ABU2XB98_9ACTN|nr:hypothetical protein [Streptomyces sp. DSM 41529]MDT0542203.1 hypothetical protein [Streptomyces sp. DSM 41529]